MTKHRYRPFTELPTQGQLVCVENGFLVFIVGHYRVVKRGKRYWYTVRNDFMELRDRLIFAFERLT